MDPQIEARDQSECRALPDWKFTLGTGIKGRAVSGPWGALSIVTNPFSQPEIVTQPQTPLLNLNGAPTGQSLAGAVTVELTKDQAALASQPSKLWIQGGTPADPILNQQYPAQYGFGALRCSYDILNGDNVEWIGYPTGVRHVFCYAYYVQPPPTSGTIIVRKQVAGADAYRETFPFQGSISYTSDRRFFLTAGPNAPSQETFYRGAVGAGEQPWTFKEEVPAGWRLDSVNCVSRNGSPAAINGGEVAVILRANDVVTCTFTDRVQPPTAGLILRKVTRGNVGTFGFDVTREAARATSAKAFATTILPLVAPVAKPSPLTLDAGRYRIRETLPPSSGGRWRAIGSSCAAELRSGLATETMVDLPAGQGRVCTFYNLFTPAGRIVLRKATINEIGTFGFTVRSVAPRPPRQYDQTATTREPGTSVVATGDDTSSLPLGTYEITESSPLPTDSRWQLELVECNGRVVPSTRGSLRVTLTSREQSVDCTFRNRLNRLPEPPEPPTDGGGGDPTPVADLEVRKTVSPHVVRLGRSVRYTIIVRNLGPDPAADVFLAEQLQRGGGIVSLRPSKGRCRLRPGPPVCALGTLARGERVTVRVVARPSGVGGVRNRVAASTSTGEAITTNNVAGASLIVLPRRPPTFTRLSERGPRLETGGNGAGGVPGGLRSHGAARVPGGELRLRVAPSRLR